MRVVPISQRDGRSMKIPEYRLKVTDTGLKKEELGCVSADGVLPTVTLGLCLASARGLEARDILGNWKRSHFWTVRP